MKFDTKLFADLAAVALTGYGGYLVNLSQTTLSQNDQTKGIVAALAGVAYLVYSNLPTLNTLFKQKPKSDRVFSPEDFEEQDFRCLVHLRNRVTEAGSKEGVETCEKLNSIIFSLHARERVKSETAMVTTVTK